MILSARSWRINVEKTDGEIKNGQSGDAGNMAYKTQNEDKQSKHNTENQKIEQRGLHHKKRGITQMLSKTFGETMMIALQFCRPTLLVGFFIMLAH